MISWTKWTQLKVDFSSTPMTGGIVISCSLPECLNPKPRNNQDLILNLPEENIHFKDKIQKNYMKLFSLHSVLGLQLCHRASSTNRKWHLSICWINSTERREIREKPSLSQLLSPGREQGFSMVCRVWGAGAERETSEQFGFFSVLSRAHLQMNHILICPFFLFCVCEKN